MIVKKLQELKDSVQKATSSMGKSEGRPVPLFWTRQFSWLYPQKPEEKFASMGNYAPGEVRIHALGAMVEIGRPGSTLNTLTSVAMRNEWGYTDGSSGFDFEWNLKYNSSGLQYGVAGHTDVAPYLSSDVFRGETWGNRFEISPLRLGLNESVEIRVRPTNWFAYNLSTNETQYFVVRFQAWGTRSYV